MQTRSFTRNIGSGPVTSFADVKQGTRHVRETWSCHPRLRKVNTAGGTERGLAKSDAGGALPHVSRETPPAPGPRAAPHHGRPGAGIARVSPTVCASPTPSTATMLHCGLHSHSEAARRFRDADDVFHVNLQLRPETPAMAVTTGGTTNSRDLLISQPRISDAPRVDRTWTGVSVPCETRGSGSPQQHDLAILVRRDRCTNVRAQALAKIHVKHGTSNDRHPTPQRG